MKTPELDPEWPRPVHALPASIRDYDLKDPQHKYSGIKEASQIWRKLTESCQQQACPNQANLGG